MGPLGVSSELFILEAMGGGTVPLGGGTVTLGGGTVTLGGGTVTLGGGTVPLGGGTVTLGGGTVPLGGGTVPLGGGTVTLGGGTVPLGGGTVPLGDLADLSVTNDNDPGCDVPEGGDIPGRSWSPRFTLRSHYDAIRGVTFSPAHEAIVTASEDATLKLWNLQKTVPNKKAVALDLEPVYAFRGHRGPVLAVAMGCDPGLCCSGGLDATIRRWHLPDLDSDPYDGYDPRVLRGVLRGHGDAVWALTFNPCGDRLVSCSADGTVRLWDPRDGDKATPGGGDSACLSTYDTRSEHGVPTSVTFSATQPCHTAVAFRSGATIIYDVEASRAVVTLEPRAGGSGSAVNQVVAHPVQPLTITAGDDRDIRFHDNRTGKVVHSMVAHLDAVTCLAVDPGGGFLLSGSDDGSLRLWQLGQGTCVRELPAHRRKHHEGVHAVAFHPHRPLSASAGADAIAKVFG